MVETDGPRNLYGLTEAGRADLARSGDDVDRVFARMSEVRQRMGGGAAPEILRAMENLKAAVRLRAARGEPADVRAITALLASATSSPVTPVRPTRMLGPMRSAISAPIPSRCRLSGRIAAFVSCSSR